MTPGYQKIIMNLEMLGQTNAEGCAACGRKFTLGETAVIACGSWEGGAKLIHEDEAIFDPETAQYYERKCFNARQGK